MTRLALPKLRVYAALAGVLLVAAVARGRPELVAIAAPFAVFLAVGLARLRPTAVTVQAELDTARAVEDDEVELVLRLKAETPLERLELAEDEPPAFPLRAGEERALALAVRCSHFGGYRAGAYVVRAFDRFGLT